MNVAISKIKKLISDTSCIRETHKEWLFQGKWLKVGCIHYTSQTGQERVWETVERTTTVSGVDGVDAIAFSENLKTIHVVAVYRPSVKCVSIELPGGLVDKGETIKQAALREFREETGQTGSIECVDFATNSDPWKSNESSIPCIIQAAPSTDKKSDPSLKLDDDEFIEPFELPLGNLLTCLSEIKSMFGDSVAVEAKLYMLARGIQLGQSIVDKINS